MSRAARAPFLTSEPSMPSFLTSFSTIVPSLISRLSIEPVATA